MVHGYIICANLQFTQQYAISPELYQYDTTANSITKFPHVPLNERGCSSVTIFGFIPSHLCPRLNYSILFAIFLSYHVGLI